MKAIAVALTIASHAGFGAAAAEAKPAILKGGQFGPEANTGAVPANAKGMDRC